MVPRDGRVVSFDDIRGADSAPPLTTIHQPFDRLGLTAVRLSCRSLMDGGSSQDIVLDPEAGRKASFTPVERYVHALQSMTHPSSCVLWPPLAGSKILLADANYPARQV